MKHFQEPTPKEMKLLPTNPAASHTLHVGENMNGHSFAVINKDYPTNMASSGGPYQSKTTAIQEGLTIWKQAISEGEKEKKVNTQKQSRTRHP